MRKRRVTGSLPKGSTAQWGLWASANRLPQSHSMKNRTYIRYSRIFRTVAWVKISRRISLPHYTVLLSLFLQFPWNPSLPTAVQSPITMKRAVFRDKPAQERTEKRFFIRMERTPSRGRNGWRRFRRASAAESAAANPIRRRSCPDCICRKMPFSSMAGEVRPCRRRFSGRGWTYGNGCLTPD